MEKEIKDIKEEIGIIQVRNSRVEKDKAWETSVTRRVLIAILTYGVIVLFFYIAKIERPFINAIVPTVGFLLSTVSVSFVKKIWIKKYTK